ncbi:MAG: PilZ domain-containing protein [Sphingomicrobium sp.]
MDSQPRETTLYSLSDDAPPAPPAQDDQCNGKRHMTLYRVGSIMIDDRRELCLIKNISAGGMTIRAYCTLIEGTPLSVELKCGQPIHGKVSWLRDQTVGIAFDDPIDLIEILSASMDGPRPRMPRIEVGGHATIREGANALRVQVCDISQGGMKLRCETLLPTGVDVVVSLPGLTPQPGVIRWTDHGYTGITFNRLLPLGELVCWLQDQREGLRAAG